jgi:pimeloyl-ACP methyl ester carboxylesterase
VELSPPRLELLATPSGSCLEYLERGAGEPTTIFAHGLGGSIGETRPLAAAVTGRRVFLHFRDHGESRASDGRYDYAALAGDLRAVADRTGATRAVGVSMGAGAILRTVAEEPRRFERLVLYLPAAIDRPRTGPALERFDAMAACVERGDVDGLAAILLTDLPPEVRGSREAGRYVTSRAAALVGAAMVGALRTVPREAPVTDRAVLRRVDVPVLVVAQAGDEQHAVGVAEELASALPMAHLHVFDRPGPLWHSPRALRELVAGFLAG